MMNCTEMSIPDDRTFLDLCNAPREVDRSSEVAPGEAVEADHSSRADHDLHDGRKPGADRRSKVDQDAEDFENCIKYDRFLSNCTICSKLAPLYSRLENHYTSMDVVLQPKEGEDEENEDGDEESMLPKLFQPMWQPMNGAVPRKCLAPKVVSTNGGKTKRKKRDDEHVYVDEVEDDEHEDQNEDDDEESGNQNDYDGEEKKNNDADAAASGAVSNGAESDASSTVSDDPDTLDDQDCAWV
jgi:hypothetical protein